MHADYSDSCFWDSRRCLLEPIPEIHEAAELLNKAADAHMAGDYKSTEIFIKKADMPALFVWSEKLWGAKDPKIHRIRQSVSVPPLLPKDQRVKARMPSASEMSYLLERDGYHCRFCGIPLIDAKIRKHVQSLYPDALRWGRKNSDQHSAFQCMWLTYDHVLPHSRGGDNSLDNLIVTCWPCNGGKEDMTLEELGLIDPRTLPVKRSSWDGLARFMNG